MSNIFNSVEPNLNTDLVPTQTEGTQNSIDTEIDTGIASVTEPVPTAMSSVIDVVPGTEISTEIPPTLVVEPSQTLLEEVAPLPLEAPVESSIVEPPVEVSSEVPPEVSSETFPEEISSATSEEIFSSEEPVSSFIEPLTSSEDFFLTSETETPLVLSSSIFSEQVTSTLSTVPLTSLIIPTTLSSLIPSSTSTEEEVSSTVEEESTTSEPPSSTEAPSTLSLGWISSTSVLIRPDTTITTVIAVPTSANIDDNQGKSTAERNSKLIGGLVGSIGGTILIGCIVVLFLFLKKRKRNGLTNQSPDFNEISDNSSVDGNISGGFFGKFWNKSNKNAIDDKQMEYTGQNTVFGQRHTDPFGANGGLNVGEGVGLGAAGLVAGTTMLSDSNSQKRTSSGYPSNFDLERQLNVNYGTIDDENEGDFAYRGVANNNNLDSVFRNSQNTSRGSNGQTPRRLRLNSFGNPLAYPEDFNFNEQENERGNQGEYNQGEYNQGEYNQGEYNQGEYQGNQGNYRRGFDDYEDQNYTNYQDGDYQQQNYTGGQQTYPSDSDSNYEVNSSYDELIRPGEQAFLQESVSNNSKSRFTEEI